VSTSTTLSNERKSARLAEMRDEARVELRRLLSAPDIVVEFAPSDILVWRDADARAAGAQPKLVPPETIGDDWSQEYREFAAAAIGASEAVGRDSSAGDTFALMYVFRSIGHEGNVCAPTSGYRRRDGGLDLSALRVEVGKARGGDGLAQQRLRVAAMNAERLRGRTARAAMNSGGRLARASRCHHRRRQERRPRRRRGTASRARARAPGRRDPEPPRPRRRREVSA
jgi:hypothetical protein